MEKLSRPVRTKKHSRRSWTPGEGHRPIKRLFTPEIKRMLKDWLVRRRENPYPSREEKKGLAIKTGLTYIQICNWFANWRRKLKNADKEPQKNTWGHLIKNYNTNASGNVEQFSICSNDSIWDDEERREDYLGKKLMKGELDNYSDVENYRKIITNGRYGQRIDCHTHEISIETFKDKQSFLIQNDKVNSPFNYFSNAKYKNHIMEKYLRGLDKSENSNNSNKCSLELSKWIKSAAKFTPDKNNYIEWDSRRLRSDADNLHKKEELDAAEALTYLAGNCHSRIVEL